MDIQTSYCSISRALLAALTLLVSGCASATSPLELGTSDKPGKGRAVFYAHVPFQLCDTVHILIAKPKGDIFETVAVPFIVNALFGSTKLASVDLPGGEYHVTGAICGRPDYVQVRLFAPYTGGGFLEEPVLRGSLGTFSVAPGEVVDLGSFTFLNYLPEGTKDGKTVVVVEPTGEDRLAAVKSDVNLGSRLVSRPLNSAATLDDLRKLEEIYSQAQTHGRLSEEIRKLVLQSIHAARSGKQQTG